MINRLFTERQYIDVLEKHFPIVPLEKYPDAMIKLYMDNAWNKICGPNFQKNRVSKRKEAKIYQHVLKELRQHYGKYANFTNFRIKDGSIKFTTNFNLIFKVKGLGFLYGLPVKGLLTGILFTEHSLERFVERIPPNLYKILEDRGREGLKADPTPVDLMIFMLDAFFEYEYGRRDEIYYLNAMLGYLVLDRYENIFVVKTFLGTDMIKDPTVQWFKPLKTDTEFTSIADVIDAESFKITEPSTFSKFSQE